MQRAAASNHTPVKRDKTSQEDTTPDISQPQPKRMRFTGKDGGKLDASTPRSSELQAISAAVAEEQRKRSEALRRASGIGQTEWVLKFSGDARILKASKAVEVVNIGGDGPPLYLVSGSEQDDSRLENETGGRMSFGNYRRRKQRVRIIILHPLQLPHGESHGLSLLCAIAWLDRTTLVLASTYD